MLPNTPPSNSLHCGCLSNPLSFFKGSHILWSRSWKTRWHFFYFFLCFKKTTSTKTHKIKDFLKESLDNPKVARLVFGLPAIALLLYALSLSMVKVPGLVMLSGAPHLSFGLIGEVFKQRLMHLFNFLYG